MEMNGEKEFMKGVQRFILKGYESDTQIYERQLELEIYISQPVD